MRTHLIEKTPLGWYIWDGAETRLAVDRALAGPFAKRKDVLLAAMELAREAHDGD